MANINATSASNDSSSLRFLAARKLGRTAPTTAASEAFTGDRLSPLDNMFLLSESPSAHMHVAITALFTRTPLLTTRDGINISRIRDYIASRLHLVPRYRQRLVFPLAGLPRWVDDTSFDIDQHVRHVSLPRPGNERQLQWIAGAIKSQPLARDKPLWEMWIVDGVDGNRFAMITKVHHCMIDGISGAALLEVLLQPSPDAEVSPAPPFQPRPMPPQMSILREELGRRVRTPLSLVSRLLHEPAHVWQDVEHGLSAVADLLPAGLRPAAQTPINRRVGPHRRFDWLTLDLNLVKQVKNRLGGSVNDVVLATVAGAVRTFLAQRGTCVDDLDFRALVPVNVRSSDQQHALGNRVAAWIVSLPVGEKDPLRRLRTLCDSTGELKRSDPGAGTELLASLSEWTGQSILSAAIRLAFLARPFNIVITNVPGPQVPLYLLDSSMVAVFPQVPLFTDQNLGIALFSYNEKLYWGFNADRDQVPDVDAFVDAISAAFADLCRAAKIVTPLSRRRPTLCLAPRSAPPRGPRTRVAAMTPPSTLRPKVRPTMRMNERSVR
jgi:WS/DGAT/MGAT family acyltransferase